MPTGVYKRTEIHKDAMRKGKYINCSLCEKSFYINKTQIKRNRKFCNRKCMQNSPEWREKQSLAKRENPINYWLGKKRPDMRGKNNVRWTGNYKSDYIERRRFRSLLQKKIFEKDNYTCQMCKKVGGFLQIHHSKSWKKYPELRFVENNCQTLCMYCHYYLTFKKVLQIGKIWGHGMCKKELSQ